MPRTFLQASQRRATALAAAVLAAAAAVMSAQAAPAAAATTTTSYVAVSQTLSTSVIRYGQSLTLTLAAPSGATQVNLSITAAGAWRSTNLVVCPGAGTTCTAAPTVVATSAGAATGTTTVTLGGTANNQVTIFNSSASVRVTPQVLGYQVTTTTAAAAVAASKPTATNTGVPAGTALTVHDGDLTVTTAGTVISGLDIHGILAVKAANVTVQNSIIRGNAFTSNSALVYASSTGLVIKDSEIAASSPTPYANGIVGGNFTLQRVNIHDVVDQIHLTSGNVRVESSWLHGNLHYAKDPNQNNGPTHDDNIQIQGGSNIVVTNSVLEGSHNAAIMITQDTSAVSKVTLSNSWANGGACTVNLVEGKYGPLQGIAITSTIFGRDTVHANCAVLSPTTTKPTLTGNTYTDGKTVTVSRG